MSSVDDTDGGGSASGGSGREGLGIRAAAVLLAGSAALSQVLGYVRDVVLAIEVGVGREADAYSASFILPDILNHLLAGGAFAIAFMPIYNRVRADRGEAEGDRVFATTLGTLGVIAMGAAAAVWIWAPPLIALQFPEFDADTRALTVRLTRIVIPAQIFFVAGGIMRSVLMAHGSFSAQAAAPLVYNLCSIVGGLATGTVEGFAWGVLVGAGGGTFLFPLFQLYRMGKLRVRVAPGDRDFHQFLWFALPLMLGVSITLMDEFYGKWIAQFMGTGSVATLYFARKLMMAPVRVVGLAIAAAALPQFSRLFAAGRIQELNATVERTLRESLAVAIVAAAGLYSVGPALVEMLYRHGEFTAEDSARMSSLLGVLVFAVPGWVVQQVAVRSFYAREDTWRPMALATGVALGLLPLYIILSRLNGLHGLALAGVLAISVNALVTIGWARWRHGTPGFRGLGVTALRTSVVCAVAALASLATVRGEAGFAGALFDLVVGSAVFVGVTLVGVFSVGDAAVREPLRGLMRRALRRASQ